MITITSDLKNYGADKTLWYYPFQGQSFPIYMETKKGYLVKREDQEDSRTWLIKHKHAVSDMGDDMV